MRAATVAIALMLGGTSLADPQTEAQSREHYARAQKLFEAADFESALGEFQRSYDLARYPAILYKIALCQDQLGHTAEAIAAYEKYLEADPKAVRRHGIEARLEKLKAAVAPLPAPAPAPAETAAPVEPPVVPAVAPAAPPPPPVVAPTVRRKLSRAAIGAIAAGSVALASAAVGAGLLGAASGDYAHLQDVCAQRQCSDADVSGLRTRLDAGYATLAIAGVAAVTAAVLAIVDARRARNRDRAWMTPLGATF